MWCLNGISLGGTESRQQKNLADLTEDQVLHSDRGDYYFLLLPPENMQYQ